MWVKEAQERGDADAKETLVKISNEEEDAKLNQAEIKLRHA